MVRCLTLLVLGLLLGVGAARADFSAEPPYYAESLHFAEYEKSYGDSSAALVIYKHQRTEMHFSTDLFTRQYVDVMYAVFDAHEAAEALNHTFPIPRGVKIKSLRAWSYTPGAAGLVWSQDADAHVTKLAFGNKLARVAVPGLSGKGLCGVRMELEWDGIGYVEARFAAPFPIREGKAAIAIQMVGNTNYGLNPVEIITKYFTWGFRGSGPLATIEGAEADPKVVRGNYGPEWHSTVRDVPAWRPEALAPMREQHPITFYLLPRGEAWHGAMKSGEKLMAEDQVPGGYLKAFRKSLKGLPPDTVVAALARQLDDPDHFRLLGGARGPIVRTSPMLKLLGDGRIEGSALEKGILATLLLKEAGIPAYLSLGSSRLTNWLDLRIPDYGQFDAVLLQIPACGPEYLWDVADRSVRLGVAGPELDSTFLVFDPEADDAQMVITPGSAKVTESRRMAVTAANEEGLRGSLSWRFAGPPQFDIDPWDEATDLDKELNALWHGQARVDSAHWETSGRDRRAGGDGRAVLHAGLTGGVQTAGNGILDLTVDLPALPEDLVKATRPAARLTGLLLTRTLAFIDTLDVTLPGGQYAGATEPVSIRNEAGNFALAITPAPGGCRLVRELHLNARLVRNFEYGPCRELVTAWRKSEAKPVSIRVGGH